VESLRLARAALEESQRLVEESNRLEKRRGELRSAALTSMGSSRRSVDEAAELLERLQRQVARKR
jgi:hypothetical protein